MNPNNVLELQHILDCDTRQFVFSKKKAMRLYGAWSADEVMSRLHQARRGVKRRWVGGPRLETARMLTHITPGPWPLHSGAGHEDPTQRTMGMISNAERILIVERIGMDPTNFVIPLTNDNALRVIVP